jgi:peptidyl-tRNA hydrolase
LRIGIGHPGDKNKVVGFVLGKPPVSEQKLIDDAVDEATGEKVNRLFSAMIICTMQKARIAEAKNGYF